MPSPLRAMNGVSRGTDIWVVAPDQIHVRPGFNPRQNLDVEDLKAFIRANGVAPLPPLRICLRNGVIELVQGHRRLQASLELMAEGFPIKGLSCQVETSTGEDEQLARAVAENHGVPLTAIEEAFAYKRLIDFNWTVEEVARRIGKSLGHVYDRLRLTQAEPEIKQAITDGTTTVTDVVKVIKEAEKTGESQKDILKKRQSTKVDKRTKTARSIPIEEQVWNDLSPIVVKYGAELVYQVLEQNSILEEVENE